MKSLRINEIFASIQGEGLLVGTPMVFVRLQGCNLECTWCDTPQARPVNGGSVMSVEDVVSEVGNHSINWVCITGGEPLLQSGVYKLIYGLLETGHNILVETNGSVSVEELPCEDEVVIAMDIKTPSSGMAERMLFDNLELLGEKDYVKFIVIDRDDYRYARNVLKKYNTEARVVFQPVWGEDPKWLADRVVKDGLNAKLIPQTHKYMGLK